MNSLFLAHEFVRRHLKPGAVAVDATAGRGNDTVFLADLVGEEGFVCAFDIQDEAIASTRALVAARGLEKRVRIIKDSHANLAEHVKDPVDAVLFNFGYLPGGDHKIATAPDSSIAGIRAALELLKPGGILSLVLYYGGDSGFSERDAILGFLKSVDFREYTVLLHDFVNRPNCPPIAVEIMRHRTDPK